MKLIVMLVIGFSVSAFAGPECTTEPKTSWLDAKKFEEKLRKEYKVRVFKTTKGNCYEIYGWNKANQKVEIYFNPVTGEKVKEEIH